MLRTAVLGVALFCSGAAVAQTDAPLSEEVFEGSGPGTTPVEAMTMRTLRLERVWLDKEQARLGDLFRPSIWFTVGTAGVVFGFWSLTEFAKMTPAYRGNAEWLGIGTVVASSILTATMGVLIGMRVKRRTEYRERIAVIRAEAHRRDEAMAAQARPEPAPAAEPPAQPAPEFLTPPPPPPSAP